MSVVLIRRGPNVTRNDVLNWVFTACDQAIVAYWCDTCRTDLPTKGHVKAHADAAPDVEHRIARQCDVHGFEAPTPKESSS